jgi:hypothetical protein
LSTVQPIFFGVWALAVCWPLCGRCNCCGEGRCCVAIDLVLGGGDCESRISRRVENRGARDGVPSLARPDLATRAGDALGVRFCNAAVGEGLRARLDRAVGTLCFGSASKDTIEDRRASSRSPFVEPASSDAGRAAATTTSSTAPSSDDVSMVRSTTSCKAKAMVPFLFAYSAIPHYYCFLASDVQSTVDHDRSLGSPSNGLMVRTGMQMDSSFEIGVAKDIVDETTTPQTIVSLLGTSSAW